MWHCIAKDRRAKYTGLFLGVALTSFITGITEPLEFMFLFVAPWLYVIHAFFDGISFCLADLFNISISGLAFQAGNGGTQWWSGAYPSTTLYACDFNALALTPHERKAG